MTATPTNPHGLTAGQTLLLVVPRYPEREVQVIKIGRVWAEISGGRRISLSGLWIDGAGYSSPGRCWLSRAAWKADKAESAAWSAFRRTVMDRSDRPPIATVDNLTRAAFSVGLGEEFTKAKEALSQ